MTSVRFSPDGTYILTAGGDGCIMKWALPYYIISAIQERILELELKEKSRISFNPQEEKKICAKVSLPEPPPAIKNEKQLLQKPPSCQYFQKLSHSLPHTCTDYKNLSDNPADSRIGPFHTCLIDEADLENFKSNLHISSEDFYDTSEYWLEDMVCYYRYEIFVAYSKLIKILIPNCMIIPTLSFLILLNHVFLFFSICMYMYSFYIS